MKTQKVVTSKMVALVSLVISLSGSLAIAADTAQQDHEAMRAAFKECVASLGIAEPVKGQRPQQLDEETRTALDSCLKEKGFNPPEHRGPPPGGRGPRGGGDQGGEGQQ